MTVIGISGYKGSGKDTAADLIADLLNKSFHSKKVSLAYALKKACMEDYGLSKEQCYDQSLKEVAIKSLPLRVSDNYAHHCVKVIYQECRTEEGSSPNLGFRIVGGNVVCHKTGKQLYWTPRALMIFKGSNQRAVDQNYWVRKTIKIIKKDSDTDIFLIPDVRYRNEVFELSRSFGHQFHLLRISGRVPPQSNDPSERDLDGYKFENVIMNNSCIEDLENQLAHFLDARDIF